MAQEDSWPRDREKKPSVLLSTAWRRFFLCWFQLLCSFSAIMRTRCFTLDSKEFCSLCMIHRGIVVLSSLEKQTWHTKTEEHAQRYFLLEDTSCFYQIISCSQTLIEIKARFRRYISFSSSSLKAVLRNLLNGAARNCIGHRNNR